MSEERRTYPYLFRSRPLALAMAIGGVTLVLFGVLDIVLIAINGHETLMYFSGLLLVLVGGAGGWAGVASFRRGD